MKGELNKLDIKRTRKVLLNKIRKQLVDFSKHNIKRHEAAFASDDGNQSDFGESEFAHIARKLLSAVAVCVSLHWAVDIDDKLLDAIVRVWTRVGNSRGLLVPKCRGRQGAARTGH